LKTTFNLYSVAIFRVEAVATRYSDSSSRYWYRWASFL